MERAAVLPQSEYSKLTEKLRYAKAAIRSFTRLGYQINENWSAALNINNVF